MPSFTKESGRTGHWTKQGTNQAPYPIYVDLGPPATDRNCQVTSRTLSWNWHATVIVQKNYFTAKFRKKQSSLAKSALRSSLDYPMHTQL